MIFFIPGDPKAQPRPSVGKFGCYKRRRDRLTDPWRNAIRATLQENYTSIFLPGPIKIELIFLIQRPKSHFRIGKYRHLLKDSAPLHHTSEPDWYNLGKLVVDEFQALGLIAEDCNVVKGTTSKHWVTENPGCLVKIDGAYELDAVPRFDQTAEHVGLCGSCIIAAQNDSKQEDSESLE